MKPAIARVQSVLSDPRMVRAIVLFVGGGVLIYLAAIFWFGWHATAAALAALGLPSLLIGAVVCSTAYLWRFGRWEYALRRLGHRVPSGRHLAIYLSGLALTATPGKSGETFRSALLLPQGVRVPHSLAAFIVDRASDVLGMCLLGFLAAWSNGHHLAWAWMLAFAVLALGSRAVAHLLLHPLAPAWWSRLGGRRWLPAAGAQAVLESWARLWTLPSVTAFSAAATLAYGTQALVFAWFCHIAGTGVSTAECVLIFVQATLFGAASMIPAGLGAMEAALVLQLSSRGTAESVAVSLAIAIRLVTLWLGMAIGALSLLSVSNQGRLKTPAPPANEPFSGA